MSCIFDNIVNIYDRYQTSYFQFNLNSLFNKVHNLIIQHPMGLHIRHIAYVSVLPKYLHVIKGYGRVLVFNNIFNNISVISWWQGRI